MLLECSSSRLSAWSFLVRMLRRLFHELLEAAAAGRDPDDLLDIAIDILGILFLLIGLDPLPAPFLRVAGVEAKLPPPDAAVSDSEEDNQRAERYERREKLRRWLDSISKDLNFTNDSAVKRHPILQLFLLCCYFHVAANLIDLKKASPTVTALVSVSRILLDAAYDRQLTTVGHAPNQ